jgi:hypothetical protein
VYRILQWKLEKERKDKRRKKEERETGGSTYKTVLSREHVIERTKIRGDLERGGKNYPWSILSHNPALVLD